MSSKFEQEANRTAELERKALRLGIEIPRTSSWWRDDSDEYEGPIDQMEYAINYYLSPQGKAGVRRLIREEKRKNIEWRVKIILPILGALISLFGLLVALVTVIVSAFKK
jgi:hypothetical protein